jgi:osmotically-inducible protein OsmY
MKRSEIREICLTERSILMKMPWTQKFRVSAVIILMSIFLPVLAFASETIGDVISDTFITAQVKSAFVVNEITRDQDISVETNNGVVVLQGTVDSHTQETAALQIAQATAGVQHVDASQLNVRPSKQPIKDMYITAKLKMILLVHGIYSAKVETESGVIYLSGFVNKAKQNQQAVQLAQSISDVVGVRSDLAVKP